jgi:hypothetical protein
MLRVIAPAKTAGSYGAYGYKARKPRRRMRGRRGRGKVGAWLKKAGKSVNAWLKKTHALSKAGQFLLKEGLVPAQYAPQAAMALKGVQMAGYGRKKKRYGSGLGLAGGALRLAGARYF